MDKFVELTIGGKKERINVHEICAVVYQEGGCLDDNVEDCEPIVAITGHGGTTYEVLFPSESGDEVLQRIEAARKAAGLD